MRTARGRWLVAAVAVLAVAGCGGPGPQDESEANATAQPARWNGVRCPR